MIAQSELGVCLSVQVIRPMFSSPPRHGAAIVVEILSNPQLYAEWRVRTLPQGYPQKPLVEDRRL